MHHFDALHSGSHQRLVAFDARVKLVAALLLLVMVTSSGGALFPLLVAGLGLGSCLLLRVPAKLLLLRFAEPLLLAAVVLVLKSFWGGGEALASVDLGWLRLTVFKAGFLEGALIACRICAAVTLVAALGFATPFTELLAALAWLRIPRGFIDVTIFAWRYLFVLADDAQVIHAAQRNRLGYVGLRRSCRSFGTLAGALVIKAFDGSQTMTLAMAQRGYDGTLPLMKHKPFRPAEVVGSGFFLAVMALIWRQ